MSATEAYLLAAGDGEDWRIYWTADGGRHWALQFTNSDPGAFYDCFSFSGPSAWSAPSSDAVNGLFPVVRTPDGRHWEDIGRRMPPAQPGEAAFAASGTCVATQGKDDAWITTGGGARARVLATSDGGQSWKAYDAPIVHGSATSGGISIAFRDRLHGILGGGDLSVTDAFTDNVARSADGGKTWALVSTRPSRAPSTGWRTSLEWTAPSWRLGRAARRGLPMKAGNGWHSTPSPTTGRWRSRDRERVAGRHGWPHRAVSFHR